MRLPNLLSRPVLGLAPSSCSDPGRLLRLLASLLVPALTASVLAGCGGDPPTQPETPADASLATPSLVTASTHWTEQAPMPGPEDLYGVFAGVVPNSAGQSILYAFGGTTSGDGGSGFSTRAYNLATNTWTPKASKVDVFESNGVGKIGSKLYFSGGNTYGGGLRETVWTTWAYDPATDQLIRKADMPKATAAGVSGVIDGKLWVLPGECSGDGWPAPGYCDHSAIRQLFRYDPVANAWVARKSAPHYHPYGAGGAIDGKFYVAGGVGVADLDAYDPATNTWKTLAPVPTAGPAIGTVLGTKLFLITQVLTQVGIDLHAYLYDPATNTWKTRPRPTWRHDALAKVLLDGHAYLVAVGGVHTELYTP
jgi:hypothetical protein